MHINKISPDNIGGKGIYPSFISAKVNWVISMMNYLKKLPIRVQLSFISLIIVIIMLFIILSSYFKIANVVEQKNNEYFSEMISQINRTIASNCDVLNRLVQNLSYSKMVQDYLNETDATKLYTKYAQVQDYLSNLAGMKDGIIDIALFGNNGTTFNLNGDIGNLEAFRGEIPKKQLFYYTGRKNIDINNHVRNCFIVGARIYSTVDYNNYAREVGTIMVVFDVNTLAGYRQEASSRGNPELYMVDRQGEVFYSNNNGIKVGSVYSEIIRNAEDNHENMTANGIKYNVQVGDIPDLGGKIIFKIPQNELLSGLDDVRKQQLGIFFIALSLLAIPFFFVINNIIQPLKKLMLFMNGIKSGKIKNLKERISVQGYAEIIIMSGEFNNMMDEINDLAHRLLETNTRLYEAELTKRQSEIDYLRSQINPHFLYNTLESIMGIALEDGSERSFNTAKALGQIFKYSIKGQDLVPLENEYNMIKNYLYIQKIRFEDRINVEYNFSEEVLGIKVPKMILQPIVENAIYHGLETKVGGGHLKLGADVSKQILAIHVEDDGVGIDQESLKVICDNLKGVLNKDEIMQKAKGSIGFTNVNNRIKLLYGNEFGIDISSVINSGTKVVIRLPFQE